MFCDEIAEIPENCDFITKYTGMFGREGKYPCDKRRSCRGTGMKIEKEDVFFIIFCGMTALVFALYRCINGDFAAYNGDFQNYNIFRRLLDGQVQYRDFTNYLGTGIVLVNFPFLWLFRSFGACVFITHFTTSIVYSFILCISFYTIFQDRKKAYAITTITAITAFVVLHSNFFGSFYFQYIYDVLSFEEQGVSMRTTRAFLPFMLVGIFYIIKHKIKQENVLMRIFCSDKGVMGVYLLLGMLTVWSNDFGYSCLICLFIIMMIVNILGKRSKVMQEGRRCCIAVFSGFIGMVLSVAIITHGNITEYIKVNKGIMEDQFWYFGNYYGKYYTLSDIFIDKKYTVFTVLFFLHAFSFLIRAMRKKVTDDNICRLFLHSVCYGASLIYVLGSGAHSYVPLQLITYILGFGLTGRLLKETVLFMRTKDHAKFVTVVERMIDTMLLTGSRGGISKFTLYICTMLFLYCVSVNVFRIHGPLHNREEVKGLKIHSVIGQGLDECAEEIMDGEVFSTYAGGLEAINGTFQPSGIDYIIHVLGDEQRDRYLDSFVKGRYPYATTLKNEYTPDEYWLLRVNWFFYRELYMHYKPTKETNYSIIWERTEEENRIDTEVKVSLESISDSKYRIDVELPDCEDGVYVDLLIKYDTVWTEDRLRNGGIRKAVCVEDGGEQYNGEQYNNYHINACYHLKESTEGFYIPIYVENGKGYACLSSYPLSSTKIENIAISVQSVIKMPEFPLHVTNYTVIDIQMAVDGVDQTGVLLKFDNIQFNTYMLERAKQIISDDEVGNVDCVWKDGNYIYVLLTNSIDRNKFVYPKKLKIV